MIARTPLSVGDEPQERADRRSGTEKGLTGSKVMESPAGLKQSSTPNGYGQRRYLSTYDIGPPISKECPWAEAMLRPRRFQKLARDMARVEGPAGLNARMTEPHVMESNSYRSFMLKLGNAQPFRLLTAVLRAPVSRIWHSAARPSVDLP